MLSFTIERVARARRRANVYTAYRVVTLHQGQEWAVSKRFNDFRALHELMKVHLPELPSNFPLWPNVFNRFDPAVIEERRWGCSGTCPTSSASSAGRRRSRSATSSSCRPTRRSRMPTRCR